MRIRNPFEPVLLKRRAFLYSLYSFLLVTRPQQHEKSFSVFSPLEFAPSVFASVSRNGGKIRRFSMDQKSCSFMVVGCGGETVLRRENCSVSFGSDGILFSLIPPFCKAGQKRSEPASDHHARWRTDDGDELLFYLSLRISELGAELCDIENSGEKISFSLWTCGKNLYSVLKVCEEESLRRCFFPKSLSIEKNREKNVVHVSFKKNIGAAQSSFYPLSLAAKYAFLFEKKI